MSAASALFRESPVRALTWFEGTAALLAVLFDAGYVALVSPYDAILHPLPIAACAVSTAVCAWSIFTIPHSRNRRFVSLAIALCTLPLVGYLPPHGISAIVLAGILASRLVFAYGLWGALIAWVAGGVAIAFRVAAQTEGLLGSQTLLLTQLYMVGTWLVLLGLVFGLLAFAAFHAKAAADVATLRERSRIALELHDAVGHSLTTLSVQLENAQRLRASDGLKADDYVQLARGTTAALLTDVRESVSLLLADPDMPEPFGVLIERLFSDFAATHSMDVRYDVSIAPEPSRGVSLALYRVAQESLTNVARHARASNLNAIVTCDERACTMIVSDDGCGCTHAIEGNGLRSMRERVASLGGTLAIDTGEERGTTVRVAVPREAPR